jgi:hypothetical protein
MSSQRYDTYGWTAGNIDELASQIGRVLGIQFEGRSSLYRGEHYRWRGEGGADLLLQDNFIEDDDGLPTDSQHPEHVVLLRASELPDEWFDRLAALPGAERLKSRTIS